MSPSSLHNNSSEGTILTAIQALVVDQGPDAAFIAKSADKLSESPVAHYHMLLILTQAFGKWSFLCKSEEHHRILTHNHPETVGISPTRSSGVKRLATNLAYGTHSKRHRNATPSKVCRGPGSAPLRAPAQAKADRSLEGLRVILQSMSPEQRRETLTKMGHRLKGAFLVFMEARRKDPHSPVAAGICWKHANRSSRASATALAHVRTIRTSQGVRFQALLHMKCLRLYSRGTTEMNVAITHQSALVEMRKAILAAARDDQHLWEKPDNLYRICKSVLMEEGSSEEAMGLGALVHMRANQLLGKPYTIISPRLPLSQALRTHSRLLRARRTSWESLREEWLSVMQLKHGSQCSTAVKDAETLADNARKVALQKSFVKALRAVECAIDLKDRKNTPLRKSSLRRAAKDESTKPSQQWSSQKVRRRLLNCSHSTNLAQSACSKTVKCKDPSELVRLCSPYSLLPNPSNSTSFLSVESELAVDAQFVQKQGLDL